MFDALVRYLSRFGFKVSDIEEFCGPETAELFEFEGALAIRWHRESYPVAVADAMSIVKAGRFVKDEDGAFMKMNCAVDPSALIASALERQRSMAS